MTFLQMVLGVVLLNVCVSGGGFNVELFMPFFNDHKTSITFQISCKRFTKYIAIGLHHNHQHLGVITGIYKHHLHKKNTHQGIENAHKIDVRTLVIK